MRWRAREVNHGRAGLQAGQGRQGRQAGEEVGRVKQSVVGVLGASL